MHRSNNVIRLLGKFEVSHSVQYSYMRPIRWRYLVMMSCRSDSRRSFWAAERVFGRDDLVGRLGRVRDGGAWTG